VSDPGRRSRIRNVAGVAVVAVGVLASIATSGISVERKETESTRIPLYELDAEHAGSINACTDGEFSSEPWAAAGRSN